MLLIEGHLFQHNKTYKSRKSGDTVLYWQCERRRDIGCQSVVTTDRDGTILKAATVEHMHGVNAGRAESRTVRHNLLVESSRRPEAAPSALLNVFVTPDTVLGLSSEPALKQAIQRR